MENIKRSIYKNPVTKKPLNLTINDGKLDSKKVAKAEKVIKILLYITIYAFILFMAIIVLIPFYWMFNTSLKSLTEIRASTPTLYPHDVQWKNYVTIFQKYTSEGVANTSYFAFGTFLSNTVIVGVVSTIGTILTTIFAAFAFAKLNFKGKDILFMLFLGTMMIPGELLVITNYITVYQLGWLKNKTGALTAMIVPFWVSVFYIFLLRQNFKQVPNELYYAAKADGKSDWNYLWKVLVPLARPTLITIFILKLMGAWNSYVWPQLIGASNRDWRLISNGLRAFSASEDGVVHYGLQMAATVVVTVPLLLLYIFFRKYIMQGVGRAGIKG